MIGSGRLSCALAIGMCFQLLTSRKWSAVRRRRQIAVVADC